MYERFEQLIQERGLTSYRIAKMTGIDAAIFSNWKRGKSIPNADNLSKIAKVLDVSVEFLLGKREKPLVDEGLEKIIEDKIREQLRVSVWNDDQARENIEIFSSLPLEKKQEALRYLRYLATQKDT
jgi:transcriptional regulator with XRE-family HTH domain